MGISGISSDLSALALRELYATQATTSGSTQTTSAVGACASQSDSIDFSKPAELFSKLQQLQSSDPEKFKEVCANIAAKLKSAAEEKGDGFEGKMLSDLAQKFQNVADGGDISQLKPPEPPSSAGPSQSGIDAYAQQDQTSLVNALQTHSGRRNQGGELDELLSSIIDEVDQAISGQ